MASTSSSSQQNAFSGIEPPGNRRKIEESSRQFDVFINHRGPDVKYSLATELYNSLKLLGIRAFLDLEERELGTSFPSTIETAIRSAKVHIAIFSKRYAESPWCLAELVHMLQSKTKIIPLFYQVEPWELRHIEKGVYAEAFDKYFKKDRHVEKIAEWKEALQQVSFTAGYEFKSSDSSDCKEIVSAVEKEVQRREELYVAKHPVGLHKLVKDFERKCIRDLVQDFESECGMNRAGKEKADVVGIFGMGGVGKTTLSKELFNQKGSEYTKTSFLFDVREASATGKLSLLQSQLLKDIFVEDHSFVSSEEGTSRLRDRFKRSGALSFLIVLDDIDHVEQIEALIPMDVLNKDGNYLVIVTTRDVGVLVNAKIEKGYRLKGLDREDGRELFCWHAFGQPNPCCGYEDLVEEFVYKCGGLPLSLQVLGRHVYKKDLQYWREELKKVSQMLPGDVKSRLKISFDSLDDEQKQIFMDVACFFIGKSKIMAMTIWEGSGWSSHHALETLKSKCLLEEDIMRSPMNLEVETPAPMNLEFEDNAFWSPRAKWVFNVTSERGQSYLRMHDHLRDLGREMANEPKHPRRWWHPQLHLKSLEEKGFQNILAQTKGRCFQSIWEEFMGCQITYFIGQPEDGSDTPLLWLELDYQRSGGNINPGIPSWIPLQQLQFLSIINGCFQRLWQSDMQAPSHLKELHIRNTFLKEFPDLSGKLNNVEEVGLSFRDSEKVSSFVKKSIFSGLCKRCKVIFSGLVKKFPVLSGKSKNMDFGEFQMDVWSLLRSLGMQLHRLEAVGSELRGVLASTDTAGRATFKSLFINDSKLPWEREVALNNEGWYRTIMSGIKNLMIEGQHLVTRILITGNCCQCLQSLKICKMKNLIEADLGSIKTLNSLEITDSPKLKRLSITPDLSELKELKIVKCTKLQELSFVHLSSLERIAIKKCTNLKSVKEICNLTKLVDLNISELDGPQELCFVRLSCLERIIIEECSNLKRVSGIPTVVIELSVRSCRDLQSVTGTGDLTELRKLYIIDCPELEELPSLCRVTCLEYIAIDSCMKLPASASAIEELHVSEYMRLSYCSNAVIRKSIDKLKSVPRRLVMIGRAVDDAESTSNEDIGIPNSVSELITGSPLDVITENWSEVITCWLVVVDSSTPLGGMNEALRLCDVHFPVRRMNIFPTEEYFPKEYFPNMCEGEWIITMLAPRVEECLVVHKLFSMFGILKELICVAAIKKDEEEWTSMQVLHKIVDRLHHEEVDLRGGDQEG